MIHIYCDGGLGNRLLSAFSALHLAKKANKPFVIHWPCNNWCGCNFTDLFSNNYNGSNFDIKFIDQYFLDGCALLIHEVQIQHKSSNKVILNRQMSQEDMVKLMVNEDDVFYYSNCLHRSLNPEEVIKTINELRLSDVVINKIYGYDVSDCCGVHIRKTDFGKAPHMNDNEIENEVKSHPDKRYFLCSDEKETEMKFKKYSNVISFVKSHYVEKLNPNNEWKSGIIDDVGRSFPFNVNRNKNSSIEAFCDMILLAQTAERLKTTRSSFSGCANLISKTKLIRL